MTNEQIRDEQLDRLLRIYAIRRRAKEEERQRILDAGPPDDCYLYAYAYDIMEGKYQLSVDEKDHLRNCPYCAIALNEHMKARARVKEHEKFVQRILDQGPGPDCQVYKRASQILEGKYTPTTEEKKHLRECHYCYYAIRSKMEIGELLEYPPEVEKLFDEICGVA